MSKFVEIMKLLPEGLKNPESILQGYVNNIKLKNNKLPEDEALEIAKRRIICDSCPFLSTNAKTSKEYKELTGEDFHTDRTDPFCTFCGCNKNLKTASPTENCGAEHWNKENPGKEIELKWFKYK